MSDGDEKELPRGTWSNRSAPKVDEADTQPPLPPEPVEIGKPFDVPIALRVEEPPSLLEAAIRLGVERVAASQVPCPVCGTQVAKGWPCAVDGHTVPP